MPSSCRDGNIAGQSDSQEDGHATGPRIMIAGTWMR